ncbi:PAS domain S-box protein [uncultured Methylibium sp.]|uniref:PAS domain S-box protein n=1 Tax=uncultured Methylibium sp. TaxID=381093 RepID=UPI0025CC9236|nr:PAS domain S-box protein [uncultured Methylibium sp.]
MRDLAAVHRALFVAYPDALLLADTAGRIVLANPAAERMLGYGAGELDGTPVESLVPAAIRPRHAAYRQAYERKPQPRPMGTQTELVALKRDGSEVMVEIALSPLQIDGTQYVVAAVRDIEAYPRMRQALQRARYSEFVAQMGRLAVDARDPQLLLQQVPAVAADALQVDAAVVFLLEPNRLEFRIAGGVGLLDDEGPAQRIPNRPDTPPGYVLREGRPVTVTDFRGETRFAVPASYLGQGLVSALAVPLADRGQTIGALMVRSRQASRFGPDELHFLESLSNLLSASLQRAQGEEALQHSQRLESVGQLTGGIAHDFNNLLTVIQGNLQVLEDHPALAGDDGARDMVAAAMRASRRGAELTGKLLAFSRRQLLSPSEVDVGELLESLAGMLRRTLDQRIRIRVDAAERLRCRADPGQLESALLNIAINSRDAMPAGGHLDFHARACAALPAEVATELGERAAHERYAEIAIVDSGDGMSETVRERVFEPFFTTKELGRGTGLGLSTVYGFVKQSQGAVRLRSSPGAGTEVTIYLPRADAAGPAAADGPQTAALPPGLPVLLVEDEDEVRAVVKRFLVALGCRVVECASGEEALAKLDAGAECRLLLTDIALGAGLRGTELARRVAERLPQAAVLLMSGYAAELLHGEGGGALPWDLLRKPYEREALARAIVRALDAR